MLLSDYRDSVAKLPEDVRTSNASIMGLARLMADLLLLRACHVLKNNKLRKLSVPLMAVALFTVTFLLTTTALTLTTAATDGHSSQPTAAKDGWLWDHASRTAALMLDVLSLVGGLMIFIYAIGRKSRHVEALETEVDGSKRQISLHDANLQLVVHRLNRLESIVAKNALWDIGREVRVQKGQLMGMLQSTASMHADMTSLEDEVLRMTRDHRLLLHQLNAQTCDRYLDVVAFGVPVVKRAAAQVLMTAYGAYTVGPIHPDNTIQLRFDDDGGPDSAAWAKQLKMEEEDFRHRAQDIVNRHLDLDYFQGGLTRDEIGRVQDLMERHPQIVAECPVEAWIVNSRESTRNFPKA